MRIRPFEARPEQKIPLDVEGAIARATNVTYKDEFYATIGNNYQAEFQTVEQAWVRRGFDAVHGREQAPALACCRASDGPEVVARCEFGHTNTDPFLRGGAWLDACNQPVRGASIKGLQGRSCPAS